MSMLRGKVLIESESPVCPIQAFAEQTENTVYFYLFFPLRKQGENLKPCWVCNCRPAPDALDAGDKISMMPKGCFSHSPEGITLDPAGLQISWFAEGDSAALLYRGNILAIIPPIAGLYDFRGFARYAVGQQRYAWELPKEKIMDWMERIGSSDIFWENTKQRGFWEAAQKYYLQAVESFYGQHTRYAAIDNNRFPMRAIIEGRKNGVIYGITAFVSVFRQPQIEISVKNSAEHARVEFGFAAAESCADALMPAYECFYACARGIHEDITFFLHGHTNGICGIPGFQAFVFLNTRMLPQIDAPQYPRFMGDPVNLLWAVPVTKAEYEFTMQNGADALLARADDLSRVHIFDGTPKFHLP